MHNVIRTVSSSQHRAAKEELPPGWPSRVDVARGRCGSFFIVSRSSNIRGEPRVNCGRALTGPSCRGPASLKGTARLSGRECDRFRLGRWHHHERPGRRSLLRMSRSRELQPCRCMARRSIGGADLALFSRHVAQDTGVIEGGLCATILILFLLIFISHTRKLRHMPANAGIQAPPIQFDP